MLHRYERCKRLPLIWPAINVIQTLLIVVCSEVERYLGTQSWYASESRWLGALSFLSNRLLKSNSQNGEWNCIFGISDAEYDYDVCVWPKIKRRWHCPYLARCTMRLSTCRLFSIDSQSMCFVTKCLSCKVAETFMVACCRLQNCSVKSDTGVSHSELAF